MINIFRIRIKQEKSITHRDVSIVSDSITKQVRAEVNQLYNGANVAAIDLCYKDLEQSVTVVSSYCFKCKKTQAMHRVKGGLKCIECWTIKPQRQRAHLRRRQRERN